MLLFNIVRNKMLDKMIDFECEEEIVKQLMYC